MLVRAMICNVRCSVAQDGLNQRDLRKDVCVQFPGARTAQGQRETPAGGILGLRRMPGDRGKRNTQ